MVLVVGRGVGRAQVAGRGMGLSHALGRGVGMAHVHKLRGLYMRVYEAL